MTYQGKLTNAQGQAVPDGTCNLRFYIYDAATGGNLLWQEPDATQPIDLQVQVSGGVFTVTLGSSVPLPPSVFTGNTWLQTKVNGSLLTPRVRITANGYAFRASIAESVVDASVTSSKIAAGAVQNGHITGNAVTAEKIASGQVVKSLNSLKDDVTLSPGSGISITPSGNTLTIGTTAGGQSWTLAGNSGTDPTTDFLGTTDSQPLELRSANNRVLRLENASRSAQIGQYLYITSSANVLGGWESNSLLSGVVGATISGGGYSYGRLPFVPTAHPNKVTDDYGVVAGGSDNQAGDNAGTTSDKTYATVGGGSSNVSSGAKSTVPGGQSNTASGDLSFAAGNRAKALNSGAFVWADSTAADFSSTADNQLLVRASGNVGINTNSPQTTLDVNGTVRSQSGGFKFPDSSVQTSAGWQLYGNASVGNGFLGTTDSTPFQVKANNQKVLWIDNGATDPAYGTAPIWIGGHYGNGYRGGVVGGFVGGGGGLIYGASYPNIVWDHYGAVVGGVSNEAGSSNLNLGAAAYAFVGGGDQNKAYGTRTAVTGGLGNTASGTEAFIGGGDTNTASAEHSAVAGGRVNKASATGAFVGGGVSNQAKGVNSTVGGGLSNIANYLGSTVGGGEYNTTTDASATIAGGYNNSAGNTGTVGGGASNTASGINSTVAGGYSNTASGVASTVGGGDQCSAQGDYTFCAGHRAKTTGKGCFTFADSTDADFGTPFNNVFMVRTYGGVYFYTGSSSGVYCKPGEASWTSSSDRNIKAGIEPIDTREVLRKLSEMPISKWSYKENYPAIRHIGPMAQDFREAFGLGTDDKSISTVDGDGVALAAIQGLYQEVKARDAKIDGLEKQSADKDAKIADLENRLSRLEKLFSK
jgi:hypothetical protein